MRFVTAPLTDDDGVMVVASARRLARRWRSGGFDYEFPRALQAGMRGKELLAWKTGAAGDVEVTVTIDEPPSGGSAPRAVGRVEIETDDHLLVLPYSQYTYCCDTRGGVPEEIDGLSARVAVPAGCYGVAVHQTGGAAGLLRFDVRLARAPDGPETPVDAVPFSGLE